MYNYRQAIANNSTGHPNLTCFHVITPSLAKVLLHKSIPCIQDKLCQHYSIILSTCKMNMLTFNLDLLHFNILVLQIDIIKSHVNIIMLHVYIIYFAYRGQKYSTIQMYNSIVARNMHFKKVNCAKLRIKPMHFNFFQNDLKFGINPTHSIFFGFIMR